MADDVYAISRFSLPLFFFFTERFDFLSYATLP